MGEYDDVVARPPTEAQNRYLAERIRCRPTKRPLMVPDSVAAIILGMCYYHGISHNCRPRCYTTNPSVHACATCGGFGSFEADCGCPGGSTGSKVFGCPADARCPVCTC